MRKFTKEHREAISKACKGRKSWIKGKKMPKNSIYKNMASHIRFDVTWEWLSKYNDIEKLKTLNDVITNRNGRWDVTTKWYMLYIEKYYYDEQFNKIYKSWIASNYEKYKKPSIDHITPKAKGGTNDICNLQFLTWFENRCKNDMSQNEWKTLKKNIGDYLL